MSETQFANAVQDFRSAIPENLFVEGERPEDYAVLLAQLHAEFFFVTDKQFIIDVAHARWMLWRRQRGYNSLEAATYEAQPNPASWTLAHLHQLALADRYKTAAERAFRRASVNLDGERQKHLRAKQLLEDSRRWEIQDIREQSRFELRKQRLALDESREARAGSRAVVG